MQVWCLGDVYVDLCGVGMVFGIVDGFLYDVVKCDLCYWIQLVWCVVVVVMYCNLCVVVGGVFQMYVYGMGKVEYFKD